jgi:hypothetical protein
MQTGHGRYGPRPAFFLRIALESSAVYRKPNATKSAALLKMA